MAKIGEEMEKSLSGFEKRFGVALGKSDFVSEGVKVACDFELESRDYYGNAAKRVSDSGVRALFQFLAKEEQKHHDYLKELEESLEKRGAWTGVPKQPRISAPDVFKIRAANAEEFEASEDSAVLSAMHAEKESQYFYARLAAKTGDAGGKKFFVKMCEFEKTHFELLDALFEQMLFLKDMQLG